MAFRRLLHSILFSAILAGTSMGVSANSDCEAAHIDLWTRAEVALSGDRLIIQGKVVRLAGIYAPRRAKQQKFTSPADPLAKQAQDFLNRLLAEHKNEVGVEYDQTKVDKFGRQLVHLFFKDGTNIEERILAAGFALRSAEQNNLKHQNCYKAAENQARKNRYQIWDLLTQYPDQHFPLIESKVIRAEDEGYRIIRGKIEKVLKSDKYYIVNFDTTGIRIPKRAWEKFDWQKLLELKGQTVEVRGFVSHYKTAMYMIVEEPFAFDVFAP
ncbi:thermonuclease family protein [Thiomicrorhabdus sp.]|uniref:thermonuclease family protein n=1 Tax=Thiomicrorhabdus sp. TaxID=2039724 RepID=UPI0029C70A9E|nr:thermonuclease family protein [Thiomicrorhabdus sp.]